MPNALKKAEKELFALRPPKKAKEIGLSDFSGGARGVMERKDET